MQPAAPHVSGAQGSVNCAQVPSPSQNPADVNVDPLQLAEPHAVPRATVRQAPAPLQVPSNPHGDLATQRPCGSVAPTATGAQAPAIPATLQAAQVPHDGDPQHTPSTQLPLAHSLAAAQA
jgi:hypothetical protein